jgi:hypothetical protein
MPQFQLATALIITTIAALWLSTLTGYSGGEDVRAFIMIGCLITSGVAALSCHAHRRAFWIGFFGALFMALQKGMVITTSPAFDWTREWAASIAQLVRGSALIDGKLIGSIKVTLSFGLILVAATAIGLICVYIYDQAKKNQKT